MFSCFQERFHIYLIHMTNDTAAFQKRIQKKRSRRGVDKKTLNLCGHLQWQCFGSATEGQRWQHSGPFCSIFTQYFQFWLKNRLGSYYVQRPAPFSGFNMTLLRLTSMIDGNDQCTNITTDGAFIETLRSRMTEMPEKL